MVADAPSSPSLSDPLPIAHCPSPPIPDALASRILSDLAAPDASLASVAQAHNISIADLSLWLTTPGARERMLLLESGGCAHVRMTASLNLSKAAAALIRVLDHHRTLSDTLAPDDPVLLRAANRATRAAYHLYRLSRITPLDDEAITRARAHLQAHPPTHLQSHHTSRVRDAALNDANPQAAHEPHLSEPSSPAPPTPSSRHAEPPHEPAPESLGDEPTSLAPQTPGARAPSPVAHARSPSAHSPSHPTRRAATCPLCRSDEPCACLSQPSPASPVLAATGPPRAPSRGLKRGFKRRDKRR